MVDAKKLEELILYIADASVVDPDFGMTKLNKILFNADFTAYGRAGEPITGQEYQKLPKGPAVRRLLPAIDALLRRGDAVVKVVNRMGYEQKRVVALREADLSLFSGDEISIIDDSIKVMQGMTAARTSDLSHEYLGWQLVEERETIPYHTVFMSDRPLTDREKKHGWELSEAAL